MKRLILLLALLAAATTVARTAAVYEAIPSEDLKAFAPLAIPIIRGQVPNPPVKVDPDPERAVGFHSNKEFAIVMMPDRALTAERFRSSLERIPVGLIVTRALSVIPDGTDRPADLAGLAALDLNEQFKLPVFFLTARQEGEALALEVFSKDATPLQSVPLRLAPELAAVGAPALPAIDRATLAAMTSNADDTRAVARIRLPGGYQAEVSLGRLPQ